VVGTGRGRLSPFFLGRLYVPRFLVGWGDFFSDFPFSPNCRFQPRIYFSPPAGVEGLFCFLPSDTPLPLRDIFGSTLKGNKICCPSPSSLRLLFHKADGGMGSGQSSLNFDTYFLLLSRMFETLPCCFGYSLFIIIGEENIIYRYTAIYLFYCYFPHLSQLLILSRIDLFPMLDQEVRDGQQRNPGSITWLTMSVARL